MYRGISRTLFSSGKSLYESNICRCKFINNAPMFKTKFISHSRKNYSNSKSTDSNVLDENKEHNLPSGLAGKYKVFRDEEAPTIFDVNEEKKRIELNELDIQEEEPDPFEGINMTRGANGVYEIEDLVEILRRDNARQLFVATVPKEYSYVDYIVIVTAKSTRHMHALATFVRKVFKIKRNKHDKIPRIEGESSKEWMALDLGNIALHIFVHEARVKYDLETLWSVGSEYDDITNRKDDNEDIMEKYKAFLKDLQPAE